MKFVFVILLFLVGEIKSSLFNKVEGDQCKLIKGDEWICRTVEDCQHIGDIRKNRPDICGFKDKVPIICCPPGKSGSTSSNTGSELSNKPSIETSSEVSASTGSWTSSNPDDGTDKPQSSIILLKPSSPPVALSKCIEYEINLCENPLPVPTQTVTNIRYARDVSLASKFNSFHQFRAEEAVSLYELPFMATIGFGEGLDISWECGGTIISQNWVLSAAHCAYSSSGKAKWIGVGGVEIIPEFIGTRLAIKQIVTHPSYKPPAIYHDIALYQHEYKLAFNSYIRPACLFPANELPRFFKAAGWGSNQLGLDLNSNLLTIDMINTKAETCGKYFNKTLLPRGFDNEIMFCAAEDERNTCTGSSGGPIFYKSSICLYVQLGIQPSGRNCNNYPGVYTRISYYLPWIGSIVWPDDDTPETFFS